MAVNQIRVIIAGGRDFDNYEMLEKACSYILSNTKKEMITIISGTAKGADSLGEIFAEEYRIPVIRKPALWNNIDRVPNNEIGVSSKGVPYWKKAGIFRNEEMAKIATHAIIFWDGKSKGSQNMIDNCKKYKLKYKIVMYEKV